MMYYLIFLLLSQSTYAFNYRSKHIISRTFLLSSDLDDIDSEQRSSEESFKVIIIIITIYLYKITCNYYY